MDSENWLGMVVSLFSGARSFMASLPVSKSSLYVVYNPAIDWDKKIINATQILCKLRCFFDLL